MKIYSQTLTTTQVLKQNNASTDTEIGVLMAPSKEHVRTHYQSAMLLPLWLFKNVPMQLFQQKNQNHWPPFLLMEHKIT